jgi:hypothetical protein
MACPDAKLGPNEARFAVSATKLGHDRIWYLDCLGARPELIARPLRQRDES